VQAHPTHKLRQEVFSLWREQDGARDVSRRTLLAVYMLVILLTGGLVSLLPSAGYDNRVVWAACALVLLMMPLVWVRVHGLFRVLFHLANLVAGFMAVYIAAHTGGINSSAMVWLNVLAVPVLLLRGPRQTLVWLALIELSIFGMMLATQQGWISSHTHPAHNGVPWALVNQVLALLDLLFAVRIYDHMQALQLQELERRNTEMQATHQALLRAQAHKDEFVAAVGHELRTPMNAILGFNGVLRRELADRPQEVEVVDHIRRSTQHLLQVVNEILDFSQLQAGKVQLYPKDVDLPATLRQLMAQREERARQKGLAWRLQGAETLPRGIHMDVQRLTQVLGLLLDNAIKFTAQGQVVLQVGLQTGPKGEQLRFEVQDTGVGIAPQRQAHIFNLFEHADVQTNRTYGGTGLGLTICPRRVHVLGGVLGVRTTPGQGAVFWLTLPFLRAQTPMSADETGDTLDPQAPLDVLVVDDNSVNLMVAKLQLQKLWPQARIATASSAAQALLLLDTQGFDVALIDMIMPDIDGMQLTQQIRQRFPAITARMPIIALTANTNPVERERCLAAGMDDVLHKPMDTDSLVHSVNAQIRRLRGAA
jgi:signal transduction histidine kinase/ActR/RegA family two-component response regulator